MEWALVAMELGVTGNGVGISGNGVGRYWQWSGHYWSMEQALLDKLDPMQERISSVIIEPVISVSVMVLVRVSNYNRIL